MQTDKHIILMGFKHTGKSTIGRALAKNLGKPFIDLDDQLEDSFEKTFHERLSCREIATKKGEEFFRTLEKEVLAETLQHENAVIALGGGTPLAPENQALIKPHMIIYVKANPEIVFERIMIGGKPSFLASAENMKDSLTLLWAEREKIYQMLANVTIDNDGTVDSVVKTLADKLSYPKKILLIHGPNLNLLGRRDPLHYGKLNLQTLEALAAEVAQKAGFGLIAYQSNHEGNLIDKLQECASICVGIIINPGALTHYSYALYDALIDTRLPVVEVHLSNISDREDFRKISVTAPACLKMIEGKKEKGYIEAVQFLVGHISSV